VALKDLRQLFALLMARESSETFVQAEVRPAT